MASVCLWPYLDSLKIKWLKQHEYKNQNRYYDCAECSMHSMDAQINNEIKLYACFDHFDVPASIDATCNMGWTAFEILSCESI